MGLLPDCSDDFINRNIAINETIRLLNRSLFVLFFILLRMALYTTDPAIRIKIKVFIHSKYYLIKLYYVLRQVCSYFFSLINITTGFDSLFSFAAISFSCPFNWSFSNASTSLLADRVWQAAISPFIGWAVRYTFCCFA